ncbi:MAG: DUF2644 domain-containing protein [Oligoflexales bacterium]|nr:DUF2644 domain-containing protein [Oligoflexales bacterium]
MAAFVFSVFFEAPFVSSLFCAFAGFCSSSFLLPP